MLTAPRCRGSGRPKRVVVLDELVGDLAVRVVEPVEIAGEGIAFKLVLNGSCDEAAQASVANVHLDACGELFLDAH